MPHTDYASQINNLIDVTTLLTFLVEEEDIVDSDFDVESGDSEVEREAEGQQEDKMIAKEERQVSNEVL